MFKDATIALGVLAVFLLVIAVALPFVQGDSARARLKAIQQRRNAFREELHKIEAKPVGFRNLLNKESFAERFVKRFKVSRVGNMADLKSRLNAAGWRSKNSLAKYLMWRTLLPIIMVTYVAFLVFMGPMAPKVEGTAMKMLCVAGAGLVGFFMPALLLKNAAQKRDILISKQFPDALDLLLVCVEAGMNFEAAFIKVTEEIGASIPEVSEEFAMTGTELAYLGDRTQALANLYERTRNADFQALSTVLTQAMQYGTSVADALRTISKESRQNRVNLIEKKAAGLGPKMTVPMIMFILPCMFLVLIGPSVIRVMELK